MEASSVGEIVWVFGIVGWHVIRYPFEHRAKRVLLFGLAILPGFYVATGIPESADFTAR